MVPTVAVIIPVLNERMLIIDALQHISCLGADEIIVVDGNSTDGTYKLVKERFPYIRCLKADRPHRAIQMNMGAQEASSDILVFLHVDVRFPEHALDLVRTRMQYGGYHGGGFKKRYVPGGTLLKLYQFF